MVDLERRGESVYYMHIQMMARYNTECLGYFSNLTDRVANVKQPGRPDNMLLQTTYRYDREMSVEHMEFCEDNILEAIESWFILS